MVHSTLVTVLLSAVSATVALGRNPLGAQRFIPGAYIYEFEDGQDMNLFSAQIAPDADTRMRFDHELFKGISVQFRNHEEAGEKAARLASMPAIKGMWPVALYDAPEPVSRKSLPAGERGSKKRHLGRRQCNGTCDGYPPHVMTQVDKLHAEGITGKGIKIAIIDTGIDYHHPALGGCFGEGCLVGFGYDLVGDDYTGSNTPVPDEDPDDCDGHGTHVAGIAAAQVNEWGFSGVAPGATLGSYRVFGCLGGAGEDVLLDAFNRAYADRPHIISVSVGRRSGWSSELMARMVSRIVEKGVSCVISNGNTGEVGLFDSGTPAVGKGVTGAASFEQDLVYEVGPDGELISSPDRFPRRVSEYSSWGPTWEMELKPQVGAPGGNILSTLPLESGGYGVLSGTSMACPFVAGAYALIAEARGSTDPGLLGKVLASTATPQRFNDANQWFNWLAPPTQQGAGLIQVYDAAYTTTLIEPSSLSFNDSDYFVTSQNFTLFNAGDKDLTYDISHVPSRTMYTLEEDTYAPAPFPNPDTRAPAKLAFSETRLFLKAGTSATIEVVATPPTCVDARRLPVWSGYISVNGSDGSSSSLTYLGLRGSLHDAPVISENLFRLSRTTDFSNKPVPANTTFTIPREDRPLDPMFYPLPVIYRKMNVGSPRSSLDVIPLSPTAGDSLGTPMNVPVDWVPKGEAFTTWLGQLTTGNYVPTGHYKLISRTLRINGDESNEGDWIELHSVPFRIQYEA